MWPLRNRTTQGRQKGLKGGEAEKFATTPPIWQTMPHSIVANGGIRAIVADWLDQKGL